MLCKIISGGQTGADRAALDASILHSFPCSGSCPLGRIAEDGKIDSIYNLAEIGGGYRARTKKNVEDADGTAVFYSGYVSGGTELTVAFCIKHKKPYKLIDIDLIEHELATESLQKFIIDYDIEILNVAGPRHSQCPEIYNYVKSVITLLLEK